MLALIVPIGKEGEAMQRKRVDDMTDLIEADLWGEAVPGAPYPMTIEQFLDWPEEEGKHYELIRGRLIEMPGTGGGHGFINTRLSGALDAQIGHLGYVLTGDSLFVLPVLRKDKPLVMGADISFTRRERAPDQGDYKAFYAPWYMAPDLAIEIASPSDRPGPVTRKALDWLAGGTRLVWVLWPLRRRADIWRPGDAAPSEVLGMADALDGGDVAPFSLPLARLF